jgi:hypothetical protein
MKKSELKALIREAVEEVMNEFSPLGVAETQQLNEKSPPNFPKALHDKLLKQYKGEEGKAYATMWKIFYEKEKGHKKINEMWTAFERKGLNEAEETDQNAEHDETDLSNPEEKREVELANQIKKLAQDLLNMHGADGEKEETATEEKPSDEKV